MLRFTQHDSKHEIATLSTRDVFARNDHDALVIASPNIVRTKQSHLVSIEMRSPRSFQLLAMTCMKRRCS
jgi:hypothetical protein